MLFEKKNSLYLPLSGLGTQLSEKFQNTLILAFEAKCPRQPPKFGLFCILEQHYVSLLYAMKASETSIILLKRVDGRDDHNESLFF